MFILEKSATPLRRNRQIRCTRQRARGKISQDVFRALISGYDNSGDLDCMFPKLYVPRRYFDGQRCGFVLLLAMKC